MASKVRARTWLSVKEVARFVGCSTRTVHAAVREGRLESVKRDGRAVSIEPEMVREWLVSGRFRGPLPPHINHPRNPNPKVDSDGDSPTDI